jgi:hypothetical protein
VSEKKRALAFFDIQSTLMPLWNNCGALISSALKKKERR